MNKPSLCERVQERASLYLDGRLEAPVRRRIQEHLKGCETCIGEYRALRRLSRLASEMPAARAPRGLARRVQRGLSQRRQETLSGLARGSWSVRVTRSGLAAAAAFLVLLPAVGVYLGYGLGRRDGAARRFQQLENEAFGGGWTWLPRPSGEVLEETVAEPESSPAVPELPAAGPAVPEALVPIRSEPAVPAVPAGLVPREGRGALAPRSPDELPFPLAEGGWWFEVVEMFESYESYQTSEGTSTSVRVRVQVGEQRGSTPERRAPQR